MFVAVTRFKEISEVSVFLTPRNYIAFYRSADGRGTKKFNRRVN
jgi:hypothetical protein